MNNVYHVTPLTRAVELELTAPGSKSITNRALLLAALASGDSRLSGVLFSDDSRHFMGCLQALGFSLSVDEASKTVTIHGEGGRIPAGKATVDVGSAGTAARFITAMLALSQGEYLIDASAQMKARPMKPLFDALGELGATITFPEREGYLPCLLCGGEKTGGELAIDAGLSSQFVSALLMTGGFYQEGLTLHYRGGRTSMPYVDMSAAMMAQFGCPVEKPAEDCYRVPTGGGYTGRDYEIEPDVSAACYFYAMAALTGGTACVRGVYYDSLQGDIRFIDLLKRLGCTAEETERGILLHGPAGGVYPGIDVDMNACSDQVMTLAALAPFASSPTTIRNIGHIRFQESDRIAAIATEMARMGVRCDETEDSITITPSVPRACSIETYKDHRMAMAFSLIGLRVPGITILDPACAAKTFEDYFEVLDGIVQDQR